MSVVIPRFDSDGFNASRIHSLARIKPRFYDDSPLPIRASSDAPRNARIVNRIIESGVATFEIRIGETSISDISLEEILEYVSAYELEEYENRAFEQERELLKAVEEEEERLRQARHERQKERAKFKGVAELRERSDGDGEGLEDVPTGKHGRARPSYKKLFKKMKERRRRKRDPVTGELVPFSDEDEAALQLESSEDDRPVPQDERPSAMVSVHLPVRRRRKRDPVTGELLPLDAVPIDAIPAAVKGEKKKRPRRRRHPDTGELMPLGWRFDPKGEGRVDSSTDGSSIPRNLSVPAIGRLSLDHEQDPKRRRLDRSSERAQGDTSRHPQVPDALTAFKTGGEVIDLVGTDDSSDQPITVAPPAKTKPKLLRRSLGGASVSQRDTSVTAVRSPQRHGTPISEAPTGPPAEYPARNRDPDGTATNILDLSANEPLHDFSSSSAENEDEAMETSHLADDEYLIEAILAHHASDPRTHPPELGTEPVMLYQVSWVGWPEPTWEPLSSFGDLAVVREYQRRVGMPVEP